MEYIPAWLREINPLVGKLIRQARQLLADMIPLGRRELANREIEARFDQPLRNQPIRRLAQMV